MMSSIERAIDAIGAGIGPTLSELVHPMAGELVLRADLGSKKLAPGDLGPVASSTSAFTGESRVLLMRMTCWWCLNACCVVAYR